MNHFSKLQKWMFDNMPDMFYNFKPDQTMAAKYSMENIKQYCNCTDNDEPCKDIETPTLELTKMALEYSFFSQLVHPFPIVSIDRLLLTLDMDLVNDHKGLDRFGIYQVYK